MNNKQLALQSHFSPAYWGLAYRHAIDLYNIWSCVSLSVKSPYKNYYGFPYDVAKYPTIPFGSMSHYWNVRVLMIRQSGYQNYCDSIFFQIYIGSRACRTNRCNLRPLVTFPSLI